MTYSVDCAECPTAELSKEFVVVVNVRDGMESAVVAIVDYPGLLVRTSISHSVERNSPHERYIAIEKAWHGDKLCRNPFPTFLKILKKKRVTIRRCQSRSHVLI